MRTKLFLMLYALLCTLFSCKSNGDSTESSSTLNKVQQKHDSINFRVISKIEFKSGVVNSETEYDPITNVFLSKDTLYLYSDVYKKLIEINTRNNSVKTEYHVDDIISKPNRLRENIYQVARGGDRFFIRYLRSILQISDDSNVIEQSYFNGDIQNVFVFNGSIILTFRDTISHFDFNGNNLGNYSLGDFLVGTHFQMDSIIFIGNINPDNTLSMVKYNIDKHDFKRIELSFKEIFEEELFLADVTEKYWVCFPYRKRDRIILIDRQHNTLAKNVKIPTNKFAASDMDVAKDQGLYPKFRVITADESRYYIAFSDDTGSYIYEINW